MRVLVFGATGHCGRAFVKRAVAARTVEGEEEKQEERPPPLTVSAFVRDEKRAREVLASAGLAPEEIQTIEFVVGVIDTRSYSSALSKAIRGAEVIVNCLSSYRSPHNQMSTLVQNILVAKPPTAPRLVHFGYPRGLAPFSGTPREKKILSLVRAFSCFKYGPAIRDHERVLQLLQENEEEMKRLKMVKNIEYTVFAAPRMVDRRIDREYYGKPGTVDRAVRDSRVWHSVSTEDAADLVLAHLLREAKEDPLPPVLCLSYAKE